MELIRLDSNPHPDPDEYPNDHRQTQYGVEKRADEFAPDCSALRVNFKRFGLGEHRRSDFAAELSWIDVRGFVREFIEMKHPEALHLQRILRLAQAVEREGWQLDDASLEDFWEILPQPYA